MTVLELASLMQGLVDSGFGGRTVYQYYDSNFACEEVGANNFRVTEDSVDFPARGYEFKEEE